MAMLGCPKTVEVRRVLYLRESDQTVANSKGARTKGPGGTLEKREVLRGQEILRVREIGKGIGETMDQTRGAERPWRLNAKTFRSK